MARLRFLGRRTGGPLRQIETARRIDVSSAAAAEHIEHLVTDTDSFSSIARTHGIPTARLLAMNGLSWSSGLAAGQRLLVPNTFELTPSARPDTELRRHRIAAGETVTAIANQHGITRRAILSANGLHPTSLIFIGQILLIPEVSVDTRATGVVHSSARHFG